MQKIDFVFASTYAMGHDRVDMSTELRSLEDILKQDFPLYNIGGNSVLDRLHHDRYHRAIANHLIVYVQLLPVHHVSLLNAAVFIGEADCRNMSHDIILAE